MNVQRKYIRIRKPNAITNTRTFLSLLKPDLAMPPLILGSPVNGSGHVKSVKEEMEETTAKTFLHDTKQNALKDIPQGYTGYSSTTIVNGASMIPLKSETNDNDQPQTVLVMPLEGIEVPMDSTVLTNGLQIHIAYNDKTNPTCPISDLDSSACFVKIRKERHKSSVHPNWLIPKPSRLLQMGRATTTGAKRGLIRFGRSRMIADTYTSIAGPEFKAQLNDTSDILGLLDLAPSTKRMMHLLNTKGVNKLFANPGRKMGSHINKSFVRHLTMNLKPVEVIYDDMPLLPIGYSPEVDPTTIKRITRKRRYPEAEEYQRKLHFKRLEETFTNPNLDTAEYISEEVIATDTECAEGDAKIDRVDIADQKVLIKQEEVLECTYMQIKEEKCTESVEYEDHEHVEIVSSKFPYSKQTKTIVPDHTYRRI